NTDRETGFGLDQRVIDIFPSVSPTLAVPYEDEMITGKATWALSTSQQLQGRYGSQQYSDIYSANSLSTPDNVGVLNSEYYSILAGHTGQFGRSMVNDFVYQYSTFENSILPVTDAPTETFANGVNAGANVNTPQTTEQVKHQFKDDFGFTTTLGGQRHDFKVGLNWINEPTLGGSFSSNLGGRYFYAGNTRESAITRIEFNSGFSMFDLPMDQYSVYAQDDWQLTDRLQLNLGLRYDLWQGFDLDQSSNSLWQMLTTQTQYNEDYLEAFRGSDGIEDDSNNWGPRLGFTYDLFGNGRSIVRGGWGKYYDFPYTNATILFPAIAVQSNFGASYLHADPNGIRNADGSLYRIGQPLPANQLVSTTAVPNEVASPTIAAPESTQASLGFSTELTNNIGVTVDLVSIQYRNIPFRFRGNPQVDVNGNGRIDSGEPRRFNQFGNFRIWHGEGEADYEGVNLGVRGRVTDRFELQGFYTWSEATGNVLAGADEFRLTSATHQPDLSAVPDQSVNPFDPACDECFGPLNTDATHRVTLSALYRAPFAINVGSVVRYRSGLPYTEWAGSDIDGDGFAFDLPAGVEHVNSRRGDDMTQVDLRLSREFAFGGGFGVEVLAEMFNIFNDENAARFVGNRAASNFGQPTVWAGDPLQPEQRLIQLGLRVKY
ncbi:MAG TPA: TonB-dependent receptor, partial [Thermoanaerobaculia bacterium]